MLTTSASSTDDEPSPLVLVNSVIDVFAESENLDDALKMCADLIVEALGVDASFIHLADGPSRQLRLAGASGGYAYMIDGGGLPFPLDASVPRSGVSGADARPDDHSKARLARLANLTGSDFSSMYSASITNLDGDLVGTIDVAIGRRLPRNSTLFDSISVIGSVMWLLVENARISREVGARESELGALVRSTIALQEVERQRVAREIHDGVSQLIVAAYYRVQAALIGHELGSIRVDLEAAARLLDEAEDESRRAIKDLLPAPLADLGLIAGIHALAKRVDAGGEVTVTVRAGDEIGLDSTLELTLYRVTQEALTNIAKHASATSATVTVDSDPDGVSLMIEDDGEGFDVSDAFKVRDGSTYGLAGMRARAESIGGSFYVSSEAGRGSRVHVRIPR